MFVVVGVWVVGVWPVGCWFAVALGGVCCLCVFYVFGVLIGLRFGL